MIRRVDPNPYDVGRVDCLRPTSNVARSYGRRYSIEFWSDDAHDFAFFFTRRGAAHWVAMQRRNGATLVGEDT